MSVKLKTSLQLSGIFPVLMALLVVVGFFVRSRFLAPVEAEREFADGLARRAAEAYSSLQACLIHGDSAGRGDWERRIRVLDGFLIEHMERTGARAGQMSWLLRRSQVIQSNCARLLDLRRTKEGETGPEPADGGEKAQIERTLAAETESFMVTVARVARDADLNVALAERTADRIFVVSVAVAGLLLTGLTVAVDRGMVGRLRRLNEVLRRVGTAGHVALPESGVGDEIGAAFDALAEMTVRVRQALTAAEHERDDCKALAQKTSDGVDKARQANMILADALTKLKRAQQRIVQQERVQALEQIVKGVAREFSAAIEPMVSTVDLLTAYPAHLDDRQGLVEHLRQIHDAAREAERQVRLLSGAFLEPGDGGDGTADVNLAVRQAVAQVRAARRASAESPAAEWLCELHAGEVPPIRGSTAELVEALAKLIQNSAEAMPRGGRIDVTTRVDEDGAVAIEVADRGEGMSEDVQARCLEPFFSTRGEGHSGMGLSYVAGLARRYGGSVDVRSAPGRGTTIALTLRGCSPATSGSGPWPEQAEIGRALRILVVDDEEYARRILAKGLAAEGHTVDTAAGGKEGRDKGTARPYDLVILDWAMADLAGDEVAAAIKGKYPQVPVILLTGMDSRLRHGDPSRLRNVDTVLGKPIIMSVLKRAIAATVGRRSEASVL